MLWVVKAGAANQLLKIHQALECLEETEEVYKGSQSKMCECCIFKSKTSTALALMPKETSLLFSVTSLWEMGVAQVCSKGRGQTGGKRNVLNATGKWGAASTLKQLGCKKFMVMWLLCLHIHHFHAFPPFLEAVIHHTQMSSYHKCTLLRKWIF